jgi:hypothetical protein
MDESRYESVEVVNTQTALLLAELNDQSHRVFKFSTFKNKKKNFIIICILSRKICPFITAKPSRD